MGVESRYRPLVEDGAFHPVDNAQLERIRKRNRFARHLGLKRDRKRLHMAHFDDDVNGLAVTRQHAGHGKRLVDGLYALGENKFDRVVSMRGRREAADGRCQQQRGQNGGENASRQRSLTDAPPPTRLYGSLPKFTTSCALSAQRVYM